MWKLSIEDDQGHKTVVNLVRDEYTIGRAADNTIRLTERNISRHHAVLLQRGSTWVLEDRGSYNGCFVNGVRVAEPYSLSHHDLIQLGDYRLEMIDESVAASEPVEMAQARTGAERLTGQPDRLVMVVGPTPGAEFPLEEERVVIGRGEECEISINHSSVSRVHAEIRQVGQGQFELLDRDSANGVRVNGIELKRALLDARDVIELGDIVLKFIPAGEVYRPGPNELKRLRSTSGAAAATVLPARVGRPVVPRLAKAVMALMGVAVLLVVAMVVLSSREPEDRRTASAPVDDAARILALAKSALERGEIEKAHVLATTGLPESSNARETTDFREIEARWADLLFTQADREADRERKRSLLERIVATPSVESGRRKRAADLLALLELPAATEAKQPEPTLSAVAIAAAEPASPAPALRSRRSMVGASAGARKAGATRPGSEPASLEPEPAPAAVATPVAAEPAPGARAAAARRSSSTSILEQATSGDRARQIAVKDMLKAKAASGRASERELKVLRGLCRQLGDPSCSN